ncbi:MAG TPA: exodeoxyribonuclease VII large subunit [Syntrophomonas sp.]|jgi:exodeoxyribonuclease VII large subunit|nr:exodeoxyribonuclease VII large subunit [Syntrophomonas sp.]HCF71792.1 exodeoxyribonuclease VII large subunit [Syntrophomonas sp.]
MNDILSVSELNNYITGLIDADKFLRNFWLQGEITGFKYYRQSGHMYFTIKDEETAISCVMFKSRVRGLDFMPEDGMEVLLRGYVSVFARQGKYQVYVEEMQPYGLGGLFLYLKQLKEKLDAKGYFEAARKKPVGGASRVGIVTSQDGAAVRDILRVIHQRNRGTEVIIVHSAVQGPEAPAEIAAGVRLLNEYQAVDVIIVGRGGGSFEDLMAFNTEVVVKAIYESNIPVISAVGHEVDFSLADLAADMRAATPTQAAQLAVSDVQTLENKLAGLNRRLGRAADRILTNKNQILDHLLMSSVWRQPQSLLEKREQVLNDLARRMDRSMNDILKDRTTRLAMAASGLDARSPAKILERGYAIVRRQGKIIRDPDEIESGDKLNIQLLNSAIEVQVLGKGKVYGQR